jgi:hypothetical protein
MEHMLRLVDMDETLSKIFSKVNVLSKPTTTGNNPLVNTDQFSPQERRLWCVCFNIGLFDVFPLSIV